MAQIPLNIALNDAPSFDSFWPSGNEIVLAALQQPRAPGIWLHGPSASGKSHLLQAATADADTTYVALREVSRPEILIGMDQYRLVAIDDVDQVLGDAEWEQSLFAFYNALLARGGCLLVSTSVVALSARFELADLTSRLRALTVFALNSLDDEGRLAALSLRATQRGLTPDDRALRYLLSHTTRDMGSLYRLLDDLDKASWQTGRRLTLPFIQSYLRDAQNELPE